ncbi:hypothetical protein NN561_012712 [Cricetulus griseus]
MRTRSSAPEGAWSQGSSSHARRRVDSQKSRRPFLGAAIQVSSSSQQAESYNNSGPEVTIGTTGVDSSRAKEKSGRDKSLGFREKKKLSRRIMAAGDPSLPPEEQCPQLSTTVSSPVIDEEIPGLPEPREEAGPPPPSARPKRKRDLSSDSEDDLAELLEPDPEPVWSVETLSGLRMKLKRRHLSTVRPEHHKVFTRLLGRYLANDMEEDNQAPKQDIFYFLYGKSYAQRPAFHKLRFQFIRSMGWKIWVSREECEEVGGCGLLKAE